MVKEFIDVDKLTEVLYKYREEVMEAMIDEIISPTEPNKKYAHCGAIGATSAIIDQLPKLAVKIRIKD